MTTTTNGLAELSINTIRTLSMDAVEKAKSGHPGAPMALAPLAYTLYTRVMKHSPKHPEWFDRDRFILSAGHASMLLYSTLYLSGYGLTLDDLKNFRQLGSPTAGHPEYGDAAGIEATTGPLGQGLSMSVGLALAEAMLAARFNRGDHNIIDHHTYVIASDGDIQEGVGSEACSLAGHLGLGKLIVFYDNNHIQLAGETSMSFSEDVGKRFEAYGWHVQDVGEDLSVENLERATEEAKGVTDRASLVIVRSHIGYGSPNKQDSSSAHGSPLGEDEVKLTKEAYGWPADETFYVPDDARKPFEEAGERGEELVADSEQRLAAFRDAEPDAAAELALIMEGRLPDGWDGDVPTFSPDDGSVATRKASQQVIQWAGSKVPNLVSGSATSSLDAHRDRRGRFRGARRLQRPQRALRRARARHGRDRERARAPRLARLRLDVLQLPRLHEGRREAGVADGDPVDLRVHPRLDRTRGGRTDPPAGRAARDPARAAEHVLRPPGRRERDRARVAVRDRADRDAHGARAEPPGPADLGPRRDPGRRDRPRRVCAARVLEGRA